MFFEIQLNSLIVYVTPRPDGYGDATAMYICKTETSSRIYVKHQYRPESEYGST